MQTRRSFLAALAGIIPAAIVGRTLAGTPDYVPVAESSGLMDGLPPFQADFALIRAQLAAFLEEVNQAPIELPKLKSLEVIERISDSEVCVQFNYERRV